MPHDEFGQIINETPESNLTPAEKVNAALNRADEIEKDTNAKWLQTKADMNTGWQKTVEDTNTQAEAEKLQTKADWDKFLDGKINQAYANQQRAREQENSNPTDKQNDLRYFRDQNNLGYGESIPNTTPDRTTPSNTGEQPITPESAEEQESLRNFRDQSNLAYGESIPDTTPDRKPRNEFADLKPGQQRFLDKKLEELEKRKREEQDPLELLRQRFAQESVIKQQGSTEEASADIQGTEQTSAPLPEAEGANAQQPEATSPSIPEVEGENAQQPETTSPLPTETEGEIAQLKGEIANMRTEMEELKSMVQALLNKNVTSENVVNQSEQAPVVNPQNTAIMVPGQNQQLEVVDGEFVDEEPEEQLSPEQQYTRLQAEREALLNGRNPSELTDEERIKYADMTIRLDQMKQALGLANEITERKQKNKERKIWVASLVVGAAAGFGIAMATPVSVAAVVAVTVGGRFAAPLIKKFGTKLESNARALKFENTEGKTPEEKAAIEKKIKRNEWWGKRLGEIAAVVSGGSAGFGIGVMAHNILSMVTGNVPGGEAPLKDAGAGKHIGDGSPLSDAPQPEIPTSPEIPAGDSGLVVDGRIHLPGSAWDGNLANGPAGTLSGGEWNPSNYTGGVHEMAAYQLNKDLGVMGLNMNKLGLDSSTVHRYLLNPYLEAFQSGSKPNLTDLLKMLNII